jgi:hypothetical protein
MLHRVEDRGQTSTTQLFYSTFLLLRHDEAEYAAQVGGEPFGSNEDGAQFGRRETPVRLRTPIFIFVTIVRLTAW